MQRPSHQRRAAIAIAAMAVSTALPASAYDGESFGVTLDARMFVGEPRSTLLADPILLVGLDTGLDLIEVSDPDAPAPLAHLYLPSPGYDLAVGGPLVYVAAGESGLRVIDIADPSRPLAIGGLSGGDARGVWLDPGLAYVANAGSTPGLRIVDVTTPSSPLEVGFIPLANGALDVVARGGLAYVGIGSTLSGPHGLAVVEVGTLRLVGFHPTALPVRGVALMGDVAVLATGGPLSGVLVTVDVAIPGAPSTLATRSLADSANGVMVDGSVAYVAAGALGLMSFDLTDPSRPVLIDALPTGRYAVSIAPRGDLAFVGERATTGAAGVTTVTTPVLSEVMTVEYTDGIDVVAGAAVGYLLRTDSLQIIDTSVPGAPLSLSAWAPPTGSLRALDVAGSLAAVSHGNAVRLLDVSDPANPVERGLVTVSEGRPVRPLLVGSILYVVNGRGFDVFDVSTPSSPATLGRYSSLGWAAALAVDGAIGYLAAGEDLVVLDLANPGAPRVVVRLPLGESLYGVTVQDGLVLVAGEESFVHVIDATTPSSPVVLARLGDGPGFDLQRYGDRVLIAAGAMGLVVVDIADPATPLVAGYYDTSGSAEAVANEGPLVHLTTGPGQHWLMTCDVCPVVCSFADVAILGAATSCVGSPVDLTVDIGSVTGCSGSLLYQWYESGSPIGGATAADYTVPASHPAGSPQFEVTVRCSTDPGCRSASVHDLQLTPDSWPTIEVNSVRGVRQGSEQDFSWTVAGGTGQSNLHLTAIKSALPDLHGDALTVLGTTAATVLRTTEDPPSFQARYYRVYGRSSCTGTSVPN